jgi:hypothetical protein
MNTLLERGVTADQAMVEVEQLFAGETQEAPDLSD